MSFLTFADSADFVPGFKRKYSPFFLNTGRIYSDRISEYQVNGICLADRKDREMGIQNLMENTVYLELPADGIRMSDELKALNDTVSDRDDCDVIIDFSRVEIINSSNISNLLILRGLLQNRGRKLILCGVSTITKCIFVVAGLAEVFVFIDDKSAALEAVKNSD
ncbi:MAG: anti-sigma factor antagonist [Sedimentisphaerales bacterium]|nr:anti-sigma factor antagonist [Sedimentisphaerales bacterium]